MGWLWEFGVTLGRKRLQRAPVGSAGHHLPVRMCLSVCKTELPEHCALPRASRRSARGQRAGLTPLSLGWLSLPRAGFPLPVPLGSVDSIAAACPGPCAISFGSLQATWPFCGKDGVGRSQQRRSTCSALGLCWPCSGSLLPWEAACPGDRLFVGLTGQLIPARTVFSPFPFPQGKLRPAETGDTLSQGQG